MYYKIAFLKNYAAVKKKKNRFLNFLVEGFIK